LNRRSAHDHRENVLNPVSQSTGLAVFEAANGQTNLVRLDATDPRQALYSGGVSSRRDSRSDR
jgi:hypothetical protein